MKRLITFPLLIFALNVLSQTLTIKATSNLGFEDYTIIRFDTAASDSYDFNYDGIKFPSQNGYPTIYTIDTTTQAWYAFNSMDSVENHVKYVNFNVLPGNGTSIDLTFSKFDSLYSYVILWDRKLNVRQIVSTDSTYSYIINGVDTNRFQLQFQPIPIFDLSAGDCITKTSKIKLGIADTSSPDFWFTMYNTTFTFSVSGHYSAVQPFASILPAGEYYLKIGVLAPPNTPISNSWIKNYFFIVDTIPSLFTQLTLNTQVTIVGQEVTFNVQFSPADFPATLEYGDGTVISVDSGQSYTYIYNAAGSFNPTLILLDTINTCKEFSSVQLDVKSNSFTTHQEYVDGKVFIVDGKLVIIPNNDMYGIVCLYDISGRLIQNVTIEMLKANSYRLDTQNLSSGVYVVEFVVSNKKFYKKIIKV